MAGSRVIRRGFVDSDRVSGLESWFTECFYHRLLLVADDFGFYDARPAYLRAQLFSTKLDKVREADVSRALLECERAGLIRFYEVDGKQFLEILRYGQRCNKSNPKWPTPPDFCRVTGTSRNFPELPGTSRNFPELPAIDGVGVGVEDGDDNEHERAFSSATAIKRPTLGDATPAKETVMAEMGRLMLANLNLTECAERFLDDCEASGWLDTKNRPIRNWKAAARNYARRYAENTAKRAIAASKSNNPKQRKDCNNADDYR